MNRYFYLFVLAVVLGAIGGYYYHEGLNEKIQYERDACFDQMGHRNIYRNIDNSSEVVIYGTEK